MSTYGSGSAPSQNTINYDSVLGTSLFNYRKTLTDNISKSNPFFYKIQENGMYTDEDGGVAIQIPILYGLGQADTYSGYDVLSTDPTDGITNAFFDWRQMAVPISISRLEERQNSQAHRMVKLLETKLMQAETGLKEFFAKQLMQGAALVGSGNTYDPYISVRNGSYGIEPLNKLIALDPTSASVQPTVGNINQSTSTWWRNQVTTSALSTSSTAIQFLQEADHVYNNCSKGSGGPPDLILVDQRTFEMWRAAYYNNYRRNADSDKNYPFENFRFNRALVMWDEFVTDIYSNSTTITYGTAYFINSKNCSIVYDKESNFINTPFVKPANQDAKVAHILWMGNTCINNRRKLGVWAKLPASLTFAT
jgi:hypothetical protein